MTDDTEAELPRHVAVAWGVAAFPQRGPKRELSHEGIVDAAVEIADAEGLDAVTMQRVASSFGFTTMALYRYVASKDELHRLMADAAIDEEALAAIPSQDWREGMRTWASVVRRRYLEHPWLMQLPVVRDELLMPGNMVMVDAALRAMRTLPLPGETKLGVLIGASLLVRGFAAISAEMFASEDRYPPGTRAALLQVATPDRFPDLAPLVANGAYLGEPEADHGPQDPDMDMHFGLEIYLDGVAALAERDGTQASAPPPLPADPQQRYQAAERAYQQAVAVRKATERRVKELYAEESQAQRARDDAKEVAKADERMRRRMG